MLNQAVQNRLQKGSLSASHSIISLIDAQELLLYFNTTIKECSSLMNSFGVSSLTKLRRSYSIFFKKSSLENALNKPHKSLVNSNLTSL